MLHSRTPSIVAPLLLVAGLATAQTPEQRLDSLFSQYNRTPSPGLAISVVRDGNVIFAKGYGLASLEHRIPITPSTIFDVASVSKQFTGLAVAMLVDQGRIALADDIRKYIPELTDVGQKISVDHLLHHTSGLRDWPGTLGLAGWRFDDVISFSQILRFAYNQKTLNFTPGSEYMYSNTGYNLLAELVARVSGKPFRTFTDETLFAPLGMADSHFLDDHTRVIPNRAFGYSRAAAGEFRVAPNNLTAMGSSSLYSSANDLAKWVINFDDPKVGGEKAMAMTRTRGTLNDGTSIPYAFGIGNGEYRGLPMANHSGGWASFSTFVMHFPRQRFGVVVLANGGIDAGRAAFDITNVFLEKELAPRPAAAPAATLAASVTVSPETLDRYVGLYRLGPGWYVRLRRDGNILKTQATREAEFPLDARSDTAFWVAGYNAPMSFRVRPNEPTQLTYRGRSVSKLPESAPLRESQLAELAGVYESDELGTTYEVELRNGVLHTVHRRHGSAPLTRLWQDDFSGGRFMSSVEFRRDPAGKVVGFSVRVDDRSRDIRFTKRK